ncbi:hypothetical protein NECAME_13000 [Necator americanus]|uniref:Uncharacterized protein n=1 Tax=Necator americanus TaxID=51031 RepID=W2SXD7_NECAM|nr:hypothetical protein NECAME_13000 [Necator americanus]ETN74424.1 hypothetical protein NECAME_13000 [Necator americanus]
MFIVVIRTNDKSQTKLSESSRKERPSQKDKEHLNSTLTSAHLELRTATFHLVSSATEIEELFKEAIALFFARSESESVPGPEPEPESGPEPDSDSIVYVGGVVGIGRPPGT